MVIFVLNSGIGAQINDDDPYGNTPLMIAANAGHKAIVQDLIEQKVWN